MSLQPSSSVACRICPMFDPEVTNTDALDCCSNCASARLSWANCSLSLHSARAAIAFAAASSTAWHFSCRQMTFLCNLDTFLELVKRSC